MVDDAPEEVVLGIFLEMQIGDLGDAKAIEGRRQIPDKERGVGDIDLMPRDIVRVEGESGGCEGGRNDEPATRDERARWRSSRSLKIDHRS